jgi:FdhE protein
VFDHGADALMLGLARNLEASGRVAVSPIRSALEGDRLDIVELLGRVSEGDYPSVAARAEAQALDPHLLWTLAQSALKPTLRAWCREMAPLVHTAGAWEKACCFICGAHASLGELQGSEQAKHLRCGQCGADWPIRRLQCIYCGNEGSLLGILYPEGRRENVRVEVCDKCHGYLKVVARFAPCSPEELALEDLSTLYLDCLAQERGYRRPWVVKAWIEGTLAEGNIHAAENLQGELQGKPLGALIEKFDAGEAYTDIHTKAKPGGEVRGQIHK